MLDLVLLPAPRTLQSLGDTPFTLPQSSFIVIPSGQFLFEAQFIQSALQTYAQRTWAISATPPSNTPHIQLLLGYNQHPQGYQLRIDSHGITLRGGSAAGIFYGLCTLKQIIQQSAGMLPTLTISDYPDFPVRGVMLDISRSKVPTLTTLLGLIDRLASWKVNQLQLYMEHTFAYLNHSDVWADSSALTGEEILQLDHYCCERHIELVPNQNSLGHMERWLKFDRYRPLAECPEGFDTPWGTFSPPTTLNPLDPASLALITSLYDELLPHFSSAIVNVGGDEPWEFGKGKSKDEAEKRGTGRLYLDYMLQVYRAVSARNHKMQFWADIIMHHPDLVPELPKDLTAMLWGYEGGEVGKQKWTYECQTVSAAGVPFYVCPGTSTWNGLIGRTDNAMDNCYLAASIGLEYGASGYLNTDWGDNGHLQPLSISYLGLSYGAAVSWCHTLNRALDMPRVLDVLVFEDSSRVIGKLVYELGNVYKRIGPEHINGQILAYVVQYTEAEINHWMPQYCAWGQGQPDLRPETLYATISTIDDILHPLAQAKLACPDADLIPAELQQAAGLIKHSARWMLLLGGDEQQEPQHLKTALSGLVAEQKRLWLTRNRLGGLDESIARLTRLEGEYDRLANLKL